MRLLRPAARLLSTLLLAVAALLLLAVTAGPRLLHYRTATMLTASMAPAIHSGDVIVDTPLALDEVRVGQVLTYHIPVDDHRVVSHRVVEVQRPAPGVVNVRTKGDANTADDPWTATLAGDTAWQVRAVVPKAGLAIRALRTPVVHTLLTAAVPLLVVCWLLLGIWRPAKPSPDGSEPAATLPAATLPAATQLAATQLAAIQLAATQLAATLPAATLPVGAGAQL